jgi:hypothetical protein
MWREGWGGEGARKGRRREDEKTRRREDDDETGSQASEGRRGKPLQVRHPVGTYLVERTYPRWAGVRASWGFRGGRACEPAGPMGGTAWARQTRDFVHPYDGPYICTKIDTQTSILAGLAERLAPTGHQHRGGPSCPALSGWPSSSAALAWPG